MMSLAISPPAKSRTTLPTSHSTRRTRLPPSYQLLPVSKYRGAISETHNKIPLSTTDYSPPSTRILHTSNTMSVYDALSIGILRRVALGETVQNPILQCLQVKAMAPSPNGMQRYRLIFSDTIHFIQSMISQRKFHRRPPLNASHRPDVPESNHLVEQEIIRKGAICRLTAFQANVVKEKPYVPLYSLWTFLTRTAS